MLPDVAPGLQFVPSSLVLRESKTQPPSLLSEADLIRLMDQNGIGTDATIHDHIKTVLDRKYVAGCAARQSRAQLQRQWCVLVWQVCDDAAAEPTVHTVNPGFLVDCRLRTPGVGHGKAVPSRSDGA